MLSDYDRAKIRLAIYDGLGWHDVSVSLGLITAYDEKKRAAVRNYYFKMAKVINQRGTRETGLQASQQRMG